MKKIKKYIHVVLIALGVMVNCACKDLAFGNKFLQKPPSTDVTIDTVFSTAEYARCVLWYSYQYLPSGTCRSIPWSGNNHPNAWPDLQE
jgi:starch-binding outer membrane protein, SusD/RagB family